MEVSKKQKQLKKYCFHRQKEKKKQEPGFWDAPQMLTKAAGLEKLHENGMGVSGAYCHKAYRIKHTGAACPDRAGLFSVFRQYDVMFQMTCCQEAFLLVLFTDAKAEEAAEVFCELEKRLMQGLSMYHVSLHVLDAQERLRLFHDFSGICGREKSHLGDYLSSDGGWLEELLSWEAFTVSEKYPSLFFKCGSDRGFVLVMLQDFHAGEQDGGFLDDLKKIQGFQGCICGFDPVSDAAVAGKMQELYLDLDSLFFRMERSQPELCRILKDAGEGREDSRHFTSAGMAALFAAGEEGFGVLCQSLSELEKTYSLRFLYLEEAQAQKEAACLLSGMGCAGMWFGRMAPSSCCGDFLPFWTEIRTETEKTGDSSTGFQDAVRIG